MRIKFFNQTKGTEIIVFFIFLTIGTEIMFSSCKYSGYGTDNVFYSGNYVDNRAEELVEVSDNYLLELPDSYSFVVITDVHIGVSRSDVPALPENPFLSWLSSLDSTSRPKFCLCLGDVADTGSKQQFDDYNQFVNKVQALGVRVYNSVGNHDLYQSGWDNWKSTCYPYTSFYRFNTPAFSFYSLDTGTGTLGYEQMRALKSALENDKTPKIIFTHYPLYTDEFFFNFDDTTDRNLMMHLFAENNVKLYLSGHLHLLECHDFGDYQAYTLPSFRYKGQWALIQVNGKAQTYQLSIIQ